jgi:nitrate reductase cytochrome c-type subunit
MVPIFNKEKAFPEITIVDSELKTRDNYIRFPHVILSKGVNGQIETHTNVVLQCKKRDTTAYDLPPNLMIPISASKYCERCG